ncbi:hypothetical protein T484DRAFT_1655400 [Baffinella frigidus]|nr:hypothetical protein T484DRAFT_1655400 [Cryptophyta sp. CCMP2293]
MALCAAVGWCAPFFWARVWGVCRFAGEELGRRLLGRPLTFFVSLRPQDVLHPLRSDRCGSLRQGRRPERPGAPAVQRVR